MCVNKSLIIIIIYSEITGNKSGDKDTYEKTDVEEEDPLVDQGNNQYNHDNNYIIQRRMSGLSRTGSPAFKKSFVYQ